MRPNEEAYVVNFRVKIESWTIFLISSLPATSHMMNIWGQPLKG
jgi:hypothetical protein